MVLEHQQRIGRRIKARRTELGMSRGEVARSMSGKTNENAIYRWEIGKHMPSPAAMEDLARVLQTDVAQFLVPEPERSATPQLMGDLAPGSAARIEAKLDAILDRLTAVEGQASATAEDVSQLAADVLEMSLEQRARELGEPDAERPGGRGEAPGGTSGTSGRPARAR